MPPHNRSAPIFRVRGNPTLKPIPRSMVEFGSSRCHLDVGSAWSRSVAEFPPRAAPRAEGLDLAAGLLVAEPRVELVDLGDVLHHVEVVHVVCVQDGADAHLPGAVKSRCQLPLQVPKHRHSSKQLPRTTTHSNVSPPNAPKSLQNPSSITSKSKFAHLSRAGRKYLGADLLGGSGEDRRTSIFGFPTCKVHQCSHNSDQGATFST